MPDHPSPCIGIFACHLLQTLTSDQPQTSDPPSIDIPGLSPLISQDLHNLHDYLKYWSKTIRQIETYYMHQYCISSASITYTLKAMVICVTFV